ncbi:L,D-transpeptidase [Kaistia dalseonensis]|uniref:Lipoprotein-anchoring transpeptidase ErfK/SrfK n=1 Tax=Kaistia dalseonensis TaxID=410840 RepID=A0ABU0H089_9HYPH|nr:L,D-transpeptidase [Kaistia dalseonensis]MCX5493169.1 L,D-transpeptidase [Kaistia dalseonensis]MDQ0435724.1 lipoprotein-anchoring transpeptidase ErfK/SrfK [Kaistia dalseonensis]
MIARLVASIALTAGLVVGLASTSQANTLFPAPAGVYAKVSLSHQTIDVVVNHGDGKQDKYSWPVSTGRKGYETPPGQFRPDYLSADHRSKKYDDAPMPFAVFFNDGIAVHGTTEVKRLGKPASHGCVRLDKANAEVFFNAVASVGMARTAIIVEQ